MRSRIWLAALALLVGSASAYALSADELIAKNAEARGGLDKLHAIKTLRLQGTLTAGDDFQLAYAQMQKRPDRLRIEASVQGLTLVQAWDGAQGWQIQPFEGRKDPATMSADDAKELAEQADIDGALLGAKAAGASVRYLGTEDVDGTEAHKLEVKLKNGDSYTVYLDPDYFLEIREVARRSVRGVPVETETDYGDYEKIAGVYFPFAIETGSKGASRKQKISIDKAEANVSLDDAMFAFPAAAGAKH
ncbi:MAG: hypothetical protein ABFC67_03455 [Mizugakiibacter sp.]|uniref:hypothetical protein n=1 Tax=Mizugakiibacter sp. TaxID=1972610 RepID=UPI0031CA0788|nr:hypothetical protein [Xanthomonadaceae bacterium]